MNRNSLIAIIAIILVIGVIYSMTREQAGPDSPAGTVEEFSNWNVYQDEAYPFQVSYPPEWTVANRESLEDRVRIDFLAPVEDEEAGHTNETNLALTASGSLSLQNLESEIEQLQNSQLQDEETIDGYTGKYYRGIYEEQPRSYRADFITTHEGLVLWFKLFTTPENAAQDETTFRQFISSIQVEPAN